MSRTASISEAVDGWLEAEPPPVVGRAGDATAPAVIGNELGAQRRHGVPGGAPRRPKAGRTAAARHARERPEWFLE